MLKPTLLATLALVTVIAGRPAAGQSTWPQFRGPGGSGIAPDEKPLPVQFGPQHGLLWKTRLPSGHSSPCIWGERIFLTGFDKPAQKLETFALDRSSGRILWRRTAPTEKIENVHEISSPAAPTPATDGQRVYVYFGSYGLLCYTLDGDEHWKVPLPTPNPWFGTGSSPIVAGERVLLNVDHEGDCYLLAIDRSSGRTVWKKDRAGFHRGWATPLYLPEKNGGQVVVMGGQRLVSYNLGDGAERWWLADLPPSSISTPVFADGLVYLAGTDQFGEADNMVAPPSFDELAKHDRNQDGNVQKEEVPPDFKVVDRFGSGGAGDMTLVQTFAGIDTDKNGAISRQEWEESSRQTSAYIANMRPVLLAVRPDGKHDVTKTHTVWRETRGVPEVPSPLSYRGRLYAVKNGGVLFCRDAKTGKTLFSGRLGAAGGYYASPVAGDGKVYLACDTGIVTVVEAGDRLNVLARNDLAEPILATPAVLDGTLYVRTEQHVYAFRR